MWRSAVFRKRMPSLWSVEVDWPCVGMDLEMRAEGGFRAIAHWELQEGARTIFIEQNERPGNRYCCLRYELKPVQHTELLSERKESPVSPEFLLADSSKVSGTSLPPLQPAPRSGHSPRGGQEEQFSRITLKEDFPSFESDSVHIIEQLFNTSHSQLEQAPILAQVDEVAAE
jgi:hypothetical protein